MKEQNSNTHPNIDSTQTTNVPQKIKVIKQSTLVLNRISPINKNIILDTISEIQADSFDMASFKNSSEQGVQICKQNGTIKKESPEVEPEVTIRKKRVHSVKAIDQTHNLKYSYSKQQNPKGTLLNYFKQPSKVPSVEMFKIDEIEETSDFKSNPAANIQDEISKLEEQISVLEKQQQQSTQAFKRAQQANAAQQKQKRSSIEQTYRQIIRHQQIKYLQRVNNCTQKIQFMEQQLTKQEQQHNIYTQFIQHNKIKGTPRKENNNVLQLYQKDRKTYMKEMDIKVRSNIKQIKQKYYCLIKQSLNRPSIYYFSYLVFGDRFLLIDFKYKDDLEKQYYEVLDLKTFQKCMGKFMALEFKDDDRYQQCVSQLQSDSQHINQMSHACLSKQLGLYKYSQNKIKGFISIYEASCNGSYLFELLQKYKRISEVSAKYLFKKISIALKHLSQQNIQQALVPSSIFIHYGDVKISYFAYDEFLSKIQQQFSKICKSSRKHYYPPQFYHGETSGVSVWSFGTMLFESIYGQKPFLYQFQNEHQIQQYFSEKLVFPEDVVVSDSTKQLIAQCLEPDFELRITIAQLHRKYFYNKM